MQTAEKPQAMRVAARFEFELDKVQGSRFLTLLLPADSVEDVLSAQTELRSQHPHCRHVCFAYVGDSASDVRFSDDGEPSKTAGYPMLKVLLGVPLRQSAAVVTRYFGGVKLGTGGLVRAYTSAVVDALRHCPLEPQRRFVRFSVECAYPQEPLVRYTLAALGGEVLRVDYDTNVLLHGKAPESSWPDLRAKLTVDAGFRLAPSVELS